MEQCPGHAVESRSNDSLPRRFPTSGSLPTPTVVICQSTSSISPSSPPTIVPWDCWHGQTGVVATMGCTVPSKPLAKYGWAMSLECFMESIPNTSCTMAISSSRWRRAWICSTCCCPRVTRERFQSIPDKSVAVKRRGVSHWIAQIKSVSSVNAIGRNRSDWFHRSDLPITWMTRGPHAQHHQLAKDGLLCRWDEYGRKKAYFKAGFDCIIRPFNTSRIRVGDLRHRWVSFFIFNSRPIVVSISIPTIFLPCSLDSLVRHHRRQVPASSLFLSLQPAIFSFHRLASSPKLGSGRYKMNYGPWHSASAWARFEKNIYHWAEFITMCAHRRRLPWNCVLCRRIMHISRIILDPTETASKERFMIDSSWGRRTL